MNSNKRINSTSRLEVEGVVVENPKDISNNIVSFYTALY